MFRSDDLIIRSLFANLGLQGPSTAEQREFVKTYEPEVDLDKEVGTVDFNGTPVRTYFTGTAFAVEDIPTFASLDEAYALAEAMIGQFTSGELTLFRVHVFLKTTAVGYKGMRLENNGQIPEMELIPGSDKFEVVTSTTRRENVKLVSIKLGDQVNWHDFIRDFNSFHS